uniref:Uncharacterized protein n=1 Tax=Anguilla anguilla TaxID=7936 RepID=A0A0E9R892_ANGAN
MLAFNNILLMVNTNNVYFNELRLQQHFTPYVVD